LSAESGSDEEFYPPRISPGAGAPPKLEEIRQCQEFLASVVRTIANSPVTPITPVTPAPARLRENLVLVLFNHNDFVTVR